MRAGRGGVGVGEGRGQQMLAEMRLMTQYTYVEIYKYGCTSSTWGTYDVAVLLTVNALVQV